MKPPFRQRSLVLAQRLADRAAAFEAERTVRHAEAVVPVGWAVLAAAGLWRDRPSGCDRGEHGWEAIVSPLGRGQDRLHRPRLAQRCSGASPIRPHPATRASGPGRASSSVKST